METGAGSLPQGRPVRERLFPTENMSLEVSAIPYRRRRAEADFRERLNIFLTVIGADFMLKTETRAMVGCEQYEAEPVTGSVSSRHI
jgi:hypothetical protein